MKNILSVIAGYALFAVSSVLLFNLTGQQPHADVPSGFKILTVFYGLFFSIASGFVLQLIARQRKLRLNFILAMLMFALAAVSMVTSSGSHWTQWFAMLIFAPASILGGYLRIRQTRPE
ncbi:MAG TPA: hypothetical protein VHA56_10910 [Mucilaginibacter sp.]|nr:hypothetical protein [Mucilaginibacter sp.]